MPGCTRPRLDVSLVGLVGCQARFAVEYKQPNISFSLIYQMITSGEWFMVSFQTTICSASIADNDHVSLDQGFPNFFGPPPHFDI